MNDKNFSISILYDMFSVSRSGYNAWIKNGCKNNKSIDRLLIDYIKEIRDEGHAYYGCRMIREEIKRRYGISYGKNKINRHIHLVDMKPNFILKIHTILLEKQIIKQKIY